MELIVAVDTKNGIAKNGEIPWKDKEDLGFFKTMTYGKTMIMGRKTYDQIGFLPGRYSIVLTNDTELHHLSYQNGKYTSFQKYVPYGDEIVIGGLEVYNLFLGSVTTIYITRIQSDFDCDKFFTMPERFQRVSKFTLATGSIVERFEKC